MGDHSFKGETEISKSNPLKLPLQKVPPIGITSVTAEIESGLTKKRIYGMDYDASVSHNFVEEKSHE